MDVATELLDGRILSGAIEHRAKPMGADVFRHHLRDLERAASSGKAGAWARRALDGNGPFLFASVSGFTDSFRQMVEASGRRVITWDLDDIFRGFETG